jgi:hypothetical protein
MSAEQTSSVVLHACRHLLRGPGVSLLGLFRPYFGSTSCSALFGAEGLFNRGQATPFPQKLR